MHVPGSMEEKILSVFQNAYDLLTVGELHQRNSFLGDEKVAMDFVMIQGMVAEDHFRQVVIVHLMFEPSQLLIGNRSTYPCKHGIEGIEEYALVSLEHPYEG